MPVLILLPIDPDAVVHFICCWASDVTIDAAKSRTLFILRYATLLSRLILVLVYVVDNPVDITTAKLNKISTVQ